MKLLFLALLGSVVLPSTSFAFGHYCQGEAQAIVQAYGGHNLQLERSDVDGWGVNAMGFVYYTFQVGNTECTASFFVSGTYFGALCSNHGRTEGARCFHKDIPSRSRRR